MIRSVSIILVLFSFPVCSHAAIVINEIAWMGDTVSANHEWIELYNSGTSVDVDGWTLTDGENLNINLSGTIASQSYVVLERTSDASAPGSAFLIYTGALKNTGATLVLKRTDGSIEDQVSGGDDWKNIGGDNTTNETAQYTSGGWVTAVATPGAANTSLVTLQKEEVTPKPTQNTSVKTNGDGIAEPLVLPGVTLSLDVLAPKQTYVDIPVEFSADVEGVGKTIENSLNYSWNFGDTNTSDYKNPTHTFLYPGTYMVYVSAEYARQHAVATHEITVLPIAVSLTTNTHGDIQVHNDSQYVVDLSEYRLRAGSMIDMPAHTMMLANQTITIPGNVLDYSGTEMVGLYDRSGELVASILPSLIEQTPHTVSPQETTQIHYGAPSQGEFRLTTVELVDEVDAEADQIVEVFAQDTSVVEQEKTSVNWPVFMLAILLFVASMVILLKPKSSTDSLDRLYEQ